jgi:DNA-directed RNA polymerase subunit RPC12/RpoP
MSNETADGCFIICPHCGEQMGDCWEWVHDEPTENECTYCDKKIIVWADYDVTYRARASQ